MNKYHNTDDEGNSFQAPMVEGFPMEDTFEILKLDEPKEAAVIQVKGPN